MAERILQKKRGNLPMVILRPSIIGAAYNEPFPGWVDALTAAGSIFYTVGLGVMTLLPIDLNSIGDNVPVDNVTDYIIAVTAHTAKQNTLEVYQASSSSKNPLLWKHCMDPLH